MPRLSEAVVSCSAAIMLAAPAGAQDDCGHWGTAAFWDSPVDHRDVLRCLHEFGRDPNAKDENGDAPLHGALRNVIAGVDAVLVLLEAGADPKARDIAGWTPLHLAVFHGEHLSVEHLLEFGANPDARTEEGSLTPLHLTTMAAGAGGIFTADALLKFGADPNAKDSSGQTPLHYAVAGSDAGTVKRLLEWDADPNARGEGGFTPLHAAAFWGKADVLEVLLGAGAGRNAKDDKGRTPLDISILWDTSVANILRDRGGRCAKLC